MSELLRVKDLTKYFSVKSGALSRDKGWVKAVDGVSLSVDQGKTLGLVGESGCGKSTTGRALMRLIEPTSGSVTFEGTDVLSLTGRDLKAFRRQVQIIFQDPYASLNPRFTIAEIITEPLQIHGIGTRAERLKQARDLLDVVGLNPEHINRYPHEFSGGQRRTSAGTEAEAHSV
jgi:ABC-type oligopeptide transport system ATPase subunit